jgi:WASH complex subunit strumpellin
LFHSFSDALTCKKVTDPLDGPPLVVGIFTLLKQFHSENTNFYLGFLSQYVRSMVDAMGR